MQTPSFEVSLKVAKDTAMASWSIAKTGSTKASGLTTIEQARVWKSTPTETSTRETLKKVRLMVKGCTTGPTVKCTTVSGRMESKKATACGKEFLEIAIWASGRTAKPMDMGCTNGKTETATKAVG